MSNLACEVESIVLEVHRRNGGAVRKLDLDCRLLDRSLGLDSLDLAEIVVVIERKYHCSPFDSVKPPRTWRDLIAAIQEHSSRAV